MGISRKLSIMSDLVQSKARQTKDCTISENMGSFMLITYLKHFPFSLLMDSFYDRSASIHLTGIIQLVNNKH